MSTPLTEGQLQVLIYHHTKLNPNQSADSDLIAGIIKAIRAALQESTSSEAEAWKESAIAWTVCASVHEQWAKGKDGLYKTRQGDYIRHAADARKKHFTLTKSHGSKT